MLKYKSVFQIKYTEAILSNSTRKLLWLEVKKNADCGLKKIYSVIYHNFPHTFFPYWPAIGVYEKQIASLKIWRCLQ